MKVSWDIKVIADNEDHAGEIYERIMVRYGMQGRGLMISEYRKFETLLYALDFETVHPEDATLEDIENLFNEIGTPVFVDRNKWSGKANSYSSCEGIIDSREQSVSMPEIFWALVYAEKGFNL